MSGHTETLAIGGASVSGRRARNSNPATTRQRGETEPQRHHDTQLLGERSRYIPATERREVYRRDAGQCTYVDVRGQRCCETRYLELHHLRAFAKRGANVAANLTLRCAAHNALAAEEEFGHAHITERREWMRHEALVRQALVSVDASD